ncbi:MAG: hypothetical protein ACOCRK_06350 [bacterium]
MRLNIKAITDNEEEVYHSYDFEGYKNFYVSTNLYDKTKKLIYENDTVEYRNNLYKVALDEFETDNGFKNVGWHLRPINKDISCVPLNTDMLNKIKVVEINGGIKN